MSQGDVKSQSGDQDLCRPPDAQSRPNRRNGGSVDVFVTTPPTPIKRSKYPPGVFAASGLASPVEQVRRLITRKEHELTELQDWLRANESPAADPGPPTAA